MTYSLVLTREHRDPSYINGIETWNKVRETLRNGLDQWTKRVHIYKYSSNDRLLGEKCVTMGNIYDVITSETDKVLI